MVPWEMVGAPGSLGGLTLITSSPVNKNKIVCQYKLALLDIILVKCKPALVLTFNPFINFRKLLMENIWRYIILLCYHHQKRVDTNLITNAGVCEKFRDGSLCK